jgi:cation:H+ antiporter
VIASLVSGDSVLPRAQATDVYLAALGALLTVVYLCGLLFRPRREWARLGPDSILVLALYAAAIAGLPLVASR